jgi:arabinan endo-1,5-alpha-L-arabinosidase
MGQMRRFNVLTFKEQIYLTGFLAALVLITTDGRAQKHPDRQRITWQNPVWDHDFPDPTVIRTPAGMYYAYGTQGGIDGKSAHIQVARSADGVHWRWVGDALPEKPAWAGKSRNFWAPHVLYDAPRKRYVLYYAAQSDADSLGMCIGVAVSREPQGPFRDKGTPLVCAKGFAAIDPMAFEDPATGKHYLYWGSDFKPLKVRQLSGDWVDFAPGAKQQVVMYPDKDHDYDKLIEGPWVLYHQGYYFLFYSGDTCCGTKAHYAVMVARSRDPEGPFKRYSLVTGKKSSVILRSNDHWVAPGHNSVVQDGAGRLWMYYHAIGSQQFKQGNYGRVMLRDRVLFRNGWPVVAKGSPSYEKQPGDAP